ncbi:MAG: AraC family transcriptional regulator [Rhodanobacter sp.]|nr:MAG: AraC family transcriptional regulator [Rhodanobacter sp.]TAM40924.1 MAG: AraC family transcriptional regulator [Rhodanobacter sp.]TAN25676.1 MAG: AraC family transcriptional regulator [Rhodanobacter sp.]
MDELSELMRHLRLQARVFHRSTHCGQWVLDAEYERKAMFHLVAAGHCVLRTDDDGADVVLRGGDGVLFSRPREHRLIAALDADDSTTTLLLCGYFEFESPLAAVLLASLPAQILLRQSSPSDPVVAATPTALLQLIIAEAQTNGPGAAALMDKLSDALFMYALRQCLAAGTVEQGLLRAISDPYLGPVLLAVHQDPQHPWTVASLADKVHLSRAAFARRFAQSVGTTPMEYVTALRMQQAHAALAERGVSVAEAAEIAGYATEAAFSRAFKRIHGRSPGALRMS